MKQILRVLLVVLAAHFQLSAQYCITGVGPSNTFDSDIEDVTLIGDNYSFSNLASCPGVVGVDDYTATDSADVSIGTGYSLNITFGTCGGQYDGVGQAWIDWNQNGTFEASESIGTSTVPASSMPLASTFSFSVPPTALLGETRLRVMQQEGGTLPLNPCGSFIWGAVEDYKIVVTNTPPACPNPTFPAISSLGDNEADIYWSGSGSNYNIEWGPAGFTQGTGTFQAVANDTVSLSGLLGNFSYDIYVQNDCSGSGNGVSSWVGPLTFTTLCDAFTAPYTENFDGLLVGNPVDCWEIKAQGGFFPAFANVAAAGAATPVSSPNQLEFNNGFSSNTIWVSPLMGGLDSNNYQLEFWIATDGGPLNVQVGTQLSPDDTASFVPAATIAATSTYTLQTIYLNAVPSGHSHIAFKHDPNAFLNSVFLDNLSYTTIPSCVPPQNVVISSTANNATVGFNFTGGTNVFYEWGPAGFTQGTGTVDTASTNPFSFGGLSPNTAYEIYLMGDCGANGNSPWAGPFSFITPCVTASLPYARDFDSWPPNCFDMTGGNQQWLHFNSDYAHGNYWSWPNGQFAVMTTEPIFIDQDAQVEFEWSHLYSTFYPNDQVVVRAQVVGSTVWDTISHLIGPTFNSPNSGNTTPGDFIQEIAYLNPTTYTGQDVRIQIIGASGFGPDVFLDNFSVDYVPSCPPPLQLGSSMEQGFQVDIHWSGGGPSWNVEWGPQGFGQGSGTVIVSPNDTLTLTGLTPTTCYDYFVQSDCGAGGLSTWSGPFTFCTTVSCPAPSGVSISATSSSAAVNYTSAGASYINYAIGPIGTAPNPANIQSAPTGSPLNLSGLTPQTQYDFWMRDSCNVGDVSSWVGPISFQTLCAPVTAPLFTDWSSTTPGSTGFLVSNCWTLGSNMDPNGGIIPRWETEDASGVNENSLNTGPHFDNTTFGQTGGMYIFLETSGGFLNDSAYASSPEVDISALTDPQLSFHYHMYGADMGTLRVDIWNGSSWDVGVWSLSGEQQTAGTDAWIKASVSLLPYVGNNVIVRFAGFRGNGFTSDMSIDDIRIDEAPSCPEPTFPGVLQADINQATVYFTAGDPAATSWVIEYGPSGFALGSGTQLSVSNDTATITGLTSATNYDFYVAELCVTNSDTSLFSGVSTFTTPVCALSNQCVYTVDMTDSFGDGWNGNVLAFEQNGVIVATFGQGFLTGTSFGPASISLCDGVPTQVVVSALGSFTNEVGFTITDPNGVVVYDHLPGNNFTAATVFTNFLTACAPPACNAPTMPGVFNVDTATADVYFIPGDPSATTWFVEYGPTGFVPGTGIVITATNDTVTLSGLSTSMTYDFYVSELCPNGVDTSSMVGPTTFSTPICSLSDQCQYTIDMTDSFGDGWNGNILAIEQNGIIVGTFGQGFTTGTVFGPDTITVCGNVPSNIVVQTLGSWTQEVGFTVYDAQGVVVYDHVAGNTFTAATVFHSFTSNCTPPACPNPSALSVNTTTTNSATVGWTEGTAGASQWYVEYGVAGFALGSGTILPTTTNPANITGLNAATTYEFYVAELCPNGLDTSNFVGPLSFGTQCAAVSVPYNTGFTGIAPGQQGSAPIMLELSNCWKIGQGAGTTSNPRWETEDASGNNENSGSTGPFFDATTPSTPGGMYLYMETSAPSGLGDTAAVVSVPIDLGPGNIDLEFYYHMYGQTMGNLYTQINDGSGWTTLDSLIGQQQTSGADSFLLRVVPLSGYSGLVQLKFLGEAGSSFYSDMSIDEISLVQNGNPNCPTPTAIMDSAYCTSADISWVSGSGTSFVEYGPAGFQIGSGTVVNNATSPYTISGLMLNTGYDYYVYDVCNGGADTSFGGAGSFITPLGPVASFTFSVNQGTVSFNASGSQGTNSWSWDFGDGNSGSGAMPTHTYLNNGNYTATLVVTDTSCGVTDTLSQIINITSVATCPQPSGLTTGNVECDSAVVSWTSISGTSLVQYGPAGFTPGTGTIVQATSPYTISGLTAGTAYDYWVADVCAASSDTSGYTGPMTFTTPTAPVPTLNMAAPVQITTTATEAEVQFDASGSSNVSDYTWDFGNGTFGSGPNPIGLYQQNASYFVTLTVSNGCGSVDTVFNVVVIGIGTEEDQLAASLNIFPNPTQDVVNAVIENTASRNYSFELIDALGQVIETRDVKDARGRTEVSFDLSNRAMGIYLLRVRTGNAAVTRRITRN